MNHTDPLKNSRGISLERIQIIQNKAREWYAKKIVDTPNLPPVLDPPVPHEYQSFQGNWGYDLAEFLTMPRAEKLFSQIVDFIPLLSVNMLRILTYVNQGTVFVCDGNIALYDVALESYGDDPYCMPIIWVFSTTGTTIRINSSLTNQSVVYTPFVVAESNAQITIEYTIPPSSIQTSWFLYAHENAKLRCLMKGDSVQGSMHTMLYPAQNAIIQVMGAFLVQQSSTFNISSQQKHSERNAQSQVSMYAALFDEAYASYQGLISIDSLAYQTQAHQTNKMLLCSSLSKARSVPTIEIETNQVQSTHASAIGRVNEQHVWLLQSRGLSYDNAKSMLINAFLREPIIMFNDLPRK